MNTVKIVYWEDDGTWLGYLQDYPDYWSQANTLDDLKEHLRDLYQHIVGDTISGIRKATENLKAQAAYPFNIDL
jgi:predicted RNase H-like HicB family nuclease